MTIQISDNQSKVVQFLKQQSVGVLATADENRQPHAAAIYYALDDDLKIYFVAKQETTKVKNITINPKVALVVYDANTQTTAQVTGVASEITEHNKLLSTFTEVLRKTKETSESSIPPVSKIKGGDYVAFCIEPISLRLAEYTNLENGKVDDIFEVTIRPQG